MSEELFCSSKLRVEVCRLQTNLCCLHCKHSEDCLALCRDNHLKIIPCTDTDMEEYEDCLWGV